MASLSSLVTDTVQSAGAAGGTVTMTATGNIETGQTVTLNSDGTVSVIGEINVATSAGALQYVESPGSSFVGLCTGGAYHPVQNKIMVFYYKAQGNVFRGVVGTVSGSTISFGTPIDMYSGSVDAVSATYDVASGNIAAFYIAGGTTLVGRVCTITGTTFTMGSAVNLSTGAVGDYRYDRVLSVYDSTNNKILVQYQVISTYVQTMIVCTVSGTSVSGGTPVSIVSGGLDSYSGSLAYDSSAQKVYALVKGNLFVGTVSGTSVSFGSAQMYESGALYSAVVYDPVNNKSVVLYSGGTSNYLRYRVVTYGGSNTVAYGTSTLVANVAPMFVTGTYDSTYGKVVFMYRDPTAGEGKVLVGKISGDSLTFDSPVTVDSSNTGASTTFFNSNSGSTMAAFVSDRGNFGPVAVSSITSSHSSTTAPGWIGIAAANITNATSGPITVIGGINTGVTNLTANTTYYVSSNGALTSNSVSTYGKIGKALTANSIIITSGNT